MGWPAMLCCVLCCPPQDLCALRACRAYCVCCAAHVVQMTRHLCGQLSPACNHSSSLAPSRPLSTSTHTHTHTSMHTPPHTHAHTHHHTHTPEGGLGPARPKAGAPRPPSQAWVLRGTCTQTHEHTDMCAQCNAAQGCWQRSSLRAVTVAQQAQHNPG